VIELLLEAESALSLGLLDRAEILYRQVAGADPRNSIAVVGLARVLLERGDEAGALKQARRALAIDAENIAAQRMVQRLEEVLEHRQAKGLPAATVPVAATPVVPVQDRADATRASEPAPAPVPAVPAPAPPPVASAPVASAPREPRPEAQMGSAADESPGPPPTASREDRRPRSFVSRLLRRRQD
jgi:hypothetical protein